MSHFILPRPFWAVGLDLAVQSLRRCVEACPSPPDHGAGWTPADIVNRLFGSPGYSRVHHHVERSNSTKCREDLKVVFYNE